METNVHSEIATWMASVSGKGWQWFVKYLAGNDTLLTRAHQAGPYIPKTVAFSLFPSITDTNAENPRAIIPAIIDSHGSTADPSLIWYNNKLRGKTRNECHLSGWGGQKSPIMDPEATGSLCLFAFYKPHDGDAEELRVWLCRSLPEEEEALSRVGPVEPGGGILYHAGRADLLGAELAERDSPCRVGPNDVPKEWRVDFPAAVQVVEFAISRVPTTRRDAPDKRLMRRRDCEFDVFRSVEQMLVLPRIREGFATVDLFVDFANTVTNRRKARSGASLELHAKKIFDEEQLPHSWDEISEGKKRPDFIFPSIAAYRNPASSPDRLQMLGVKTTCKDRWRQIINEADRIPQKYLLTLQEGVSGNQLDEMAAHGVILVVPARLHKRFPETHRLTILTLEHFIQMTKAKCA